MAKINWDESYSVNVKIIDSQHKKLFSLLAELEDLFARDREDFAALEDIIFDLGAYVQFHFGEEEKYFAEFNYENAAAHKKQHQLYVDKIKEFRLSCLEKDPGLFKKMLDFVEDWIANHIKISDKKYSRCFNEHGLK